MPREPDPAGGTGAGRVAVELVEHMPGPTSTGIGRFTAELLRRLARHVSVRRARSIDPPGVGRFPVLHHLPLGVADHQPGAVVHFVQIMGCSQMLWRPVHPAVGTVHDLGLLVRPAEAAMFKPLDHLLLHLSYRGLTRLDAIMAISDFTRQTVIERLHIPAERVFRIYLGIDSERFKRVPDARRQLQSRYSLPGEPSDCYLLYVGSELPRKNLATLLRALSLLPPSVRLLKVGSAGGDRFRAETERHLTELGLVGRVTFVDHVPESDLPLFYSSADCYVCASFLEGFGLPVLEAMACGVPIVCADAAALPEIAGDAALLAPPHDARAFAAAIQTLLADPALGAALAARGRRRAAAFSWERTARDVRSLYEHLVQRAAPLRQSP